MIPDHGKHLAVALKFRAWFTWVDLVVLQVQNSNGLAASALHSDEVRIRQRLKVSRSHDHAVKPRCNAIVGVHGDRRRLQEQVCFL